MNSTMHHEQDASTTDYPLQERLAAFPLSSRAVYRELEISEEPLTLRELQERLRTPRRTVSKGLKRMIDDGLVERHCLATDPGNSIYTVAHGPRGGESQ